MFCFHRVLWGFFVLVTYLKGLAEGWSPSSLGFSSASASHVQPACSSFSDCHSLEFLWPSLAAFSLKPLVLSQQWIGPYEQSLISSVPNTLYCCLFKSLVYQPGPSSNWPLWFLASLLISLTSQYSLYQTRFAAACRVWPPFLLSSLCRESVQPLFCPETILSLDGWGVNPLKCCN